MPMRKQAAGLLAGLALLFATLALAFAADLPALTGRVVDQANVIDAATEARLTQALADFEAKSSDQLVVATVASLDGEPIEPYANRLFRAWQLGQAGENNGVLLLVAPNDRRMRIEVGYGLEGTLTDLHSKLIIENVLVPAFRAGDFGPGIEAAATDIVGVLSGDAAELEARYQRNPPSSSSDDSGVPIFVVLFILVWATIFFGSIFMAVLVPRFGRKIGRNRYVWRGMTFDFNNKGGSSSGSSSSSSSGWSSGGSSSSGGGFSGGGGSSGGGGASGSW